MLPRACLPPVAVALVLLGACFQNPGELDVCTYSDPTFCDGSSAGSTSTGLAMDSAGTPTASTSTTTTGASAGIGESGGKSDDTGPNSDDAASRTLRRVDRRLDGAGVERPTIPHGPVVGRVEGAPGDLRHGVRRYGPRDADEA